MLKIPEEIEHQLNTIITDYKELASLQKALCTCDNADYGKDNEKGRLLTSILTRMEAIELKTLSTLVDLVRGFELLCSKQSIASKLLDPIKLFKPHKMIEQAFSNRTTLPQSFFEIGCQTYNMLIQRPKQNKESSELSGLIAARHLVQFDGDVHDVVAIIQSLIRMWSLILESNLDCDKHAFIKQSRSVEVDMWVGGGFYKAATKLFPALNTNKPAQIISPELTVAKKDIQDRLSRIELYYCERYDSRDALRKLCGRDARERTKTYQRVILKMQVAEDNLLHELYHLGDNVKKYLTKCSRSRDFKIIESFKPYRWCGNYINYLKHGAKGKKRPAMPGYQMQVFDQNGAEPTVEDKLVDCLFMINIDGRLENEMDIAHRLIDIWFLFLRYHSDINLTDITASINSIRQKEFVGMSLYSAKIPDGLLNDAKKQAQERRKLDL